MSRLLSPIATLRRCSVWVAGVVLAVLAPASEASDFYKLTIISESPQTVGTNWRIVGGFVGINDAGVVTWRADRFVNGALEGGVFAGNGITQTTIATGPVQVPSINNLGQVMYVDNSSGSRMRLWDQGLVSDFYVCNQTPNPLGCYAGGLSDNTRVPLRLTGNPIGLGIVGAGGQVVTSGAFSNVTTWYTDPAISRNGRNAAIVGRSNTSGDVVIGALDQTRPGQVGQLTLGPPSEWSIPGLSMNDLGNIAFFTYGGSSATVRRFVGVVNARSSSPSLIRIADTTDGTFTDFGTTPLDLGINNLNEVAFFGRGGTNNANNGVYVGDVSGRTPKPAVVFNEVITTDGARFTGVFQNGFSSQSINEKGQIAFYANIQRASTNYYAILRADPLPGVAPGNPILPDAGTPLPSGWRFVMRCSPTTLCGGVGSRAPRRYIDPPLAVGYTYQVEAPGPNFASVYIPAPLPNGDDTFQVEFNGQTAALQAGVAFDFTTVVPGGVSTFRITGIDTTEALDPANATAFVTGLTFVTDSTTDYSVTMVPIIADPNDTDLDGVPNATDLCPNTAPGAVVDSNGCSASQRDSDGDGVVDSLDQCPATPLGTPVNANGCSALQLDADGDGVPNTADVCPNTPLGAAVNSVGCALSQLDSDGDGVNDAIDQCPNTPAGATVNAVGCAALQLDSDGDGVNDALDKCPNTPAGAIVNADGCAASQLDSDGDGVPNSIDQCPNTPAGSSVNALGCSTSQLDSDGDGVTDNLDACPGTPAGTPVGANGCPITPPSGKTCDVNGDNFIDYRDIRLILLSIGKPLTSAIDPRDANRDGKINLTDAALCTAKCDRYLCLPPK